MIYLHWTLLTLYILAVAATIVAVLLDNRQPVKTMAWVMVLCFVPVAGLVLYFFFGQNTRKERVISRLSLDQLTKRAMLEFVEQRGLFVPPEHRGLVQLFANQSMALPFKDNEVDIYTNGHDFFLALLAAIGGARQSIHVDSYIFADDALGRLVSDALADKAREGLEVRVVYDDVGNWQVSHAFYENMRLQGIEVHAFMPVKFPAFTSKMNYRNHRKVCVIDGAVGFIGGMNIALRYVKGNSSGPWRDTHLKIRGGAVYGLQRAFLIDWYFVDRTLISNRKYYPPITVQPNSCVAQIVTSSPVSPWPDIMQGYVRILLAAKQYVYMESPYFLPTEPVLFAMRTAALAGIKVKLVIPLHTDARLVQWASRSYVAEAAEAGVQVYLYSKGFLHSKLLVSDDSLCSCGSTNVDFRSFENNFEANAFFYHTPLALRMKAVFEEDLKHCISFSEYRQHTHLPFAMRLWESVVRLLSPLL